MLFTLMWDILCVSAVRAFEIPSKNEKEPRVELVQFAQCLTDKGWVMYSSFTCSACRAQIKLFGRAAGHLKIVECNPHAPDTRVQQCMEKKIRYTPTWVLEKKDTEVKRNKGFKKLEDLAAMSGCDL